MKIALAFLFAVCIVVTYFFFSLRFSEKLVEPGEGVLGISDFAYHEKLAEAFWFEGLESVYELSSQTQVTSKLAGQQLKFAMPVGVSPIGFLFLYPLAALGRTNLLYANSLWIGISLAVFISGLLLAFREAKVLPNQQKLLLGLCFLAVVCSFLPIICLAIGQTALFASGLLIVLFYLLHRVEERPEFVVPVMFLLAVKPIYFFLGLSALIIYGRRREVLFSCGALLAGLLAFTFFDSSWFGSYTEQLLLYTRSEIPPEYRSSIVRNSTITFLSAFSGNIWLSRFFVGISLGIPAWFVIRCKAPKSSTLWFIVSAGLLLLFIPYLGGYEELLLASLLTLVVFSGKGFQPFWLGLLAALCICIVFNFGLFAAGKPLWAFWLLKLAFFSALGMALSRCKEFETLP